MAARNRARARSLRTQQRAEAVPSAPSTGPPQKLRLYWVEARHGPADWSVFHPEAPLRHDRPDVGLDPPRGADTVRCARCSLERR